MINYALIGQLCFSLATACSLVIFLFKPIYQEPQPLLQAKLLAKLTTFALVMQTFCLIVLAAAMLSDDFSIRYVAENSNTDLPWQYKISAVWGGHEGSLLLWIFMLHLWAAALIWRTLTTYQDKKFILAVHAQKILYAIISLFSLFCLLSSNPFTTHWPIPKQGRDLNPLLQDPGLIFHPPMLYLGYVGLAVAFALALASIWHQQDGKLHLINTFAKAARPWTLVAWMFLTLGITLGSYWAYYELGWGGYWFWDPVENASFMPWLVATALVHSLATSKTQPGFIAWSLFLALLAFCLSLLGAFLVRSGVITSVHAFANDPDRGLFLLGILAIFILIAFTTFARRYRQLPKAPVVNLGSKQFYLLINNCFVICAAASVLIGTLFPLISETFAWGQFSVGKPYFENMMIAFFVPLCIFAPIATYSKWNKDSLRRASSLLLIAAIALSASLAIHLLAFPLTIASFIALTLGLWIILAEIAQLIKTPTKTNLGMQIAHFGLALFIIGTVFSSQHSTQREIAISKGESYQLQGIKFTLEEIDSLKGPNYQSIYANIAVLDLAQNSFTLRPEKRFYNSSPMPMTEVAIDASLSRDIYATIGNLPEQSERYVLQLHIKPFIRLIWLGATLMAIGALWATRTRRKKHGY